MVRSNMKDLKKRAEEVVGTDAISLTSVADRLELGRDEVALLEIDGNYKILRVIDIGKGVTVAKDAITTSGKVVMARHYLYDWDKLCGDNKKKRGEFQDENAFRYLVIKIQEDKTFLGGEEWMEQMCQMKGEIWDKALRLLSELYDKDIKTLRLWVDVCSIGTPYLFLKSYGRFKAWLDLVGDKEVKKQTKILASLA